MLFDLRFKPFDLLFEIALLANRFIAHQTARGLLTLRAGQLLTEPLRP